MFDLARPLVLIAALALAATPALAQPAPVSGFNPTTSAVSEGKLLGLQPQVTGTITIPDAKAAVLIQPEGKSWRDFQRGTVPWLSAVTVLGMLGVLAVFYLVRGRIRIEGGPSGRTLRRFNPFERFVHWLTAGSFVVLALTGLNLSVGRFVLLRLQPEARGAARWIAVTALEAGPALHGLRAAVYSRPPETTPRALPPERAAD